MPFLGKQPTSGFASIVKDDLTGNGTTSLHVIETSCKRKRYRCLRW